MKKDKKSILDTFKKIFKKQTKIEKDKRTKRKNIKKNKPRGFTARRIGAVTFWLLFSFMFLIVAITMFGGSTEGDSSEHELVNSKVVSHEAIEYSKSFIFDLYNAADESELRENKIKKYVPNNLNISEALSFDKTLSVEVKKDDIVLYDLTQTNDEKARHIFSVKLKTKTQLSEIEEKEYEEAKDDYLNIVMQEDETITGIKNNQILRDIEIYVVIPIAYSDDSFVIYDYPSYTFIEDSEDKSVESILDLLENETDSEIESNVSAFLDVFFKSFATDSADQLSYILNDEYYKNGLANSLTFNSVKDFSLYKGKDEDMVVDVTVTFTQDKTGLNVTSNYILVIAQKEQRYVVNHINNDEYLYELVYGEKNEEDEQNEVDEQNNNSNNELNSEDNDENDMPSTTPKESFEELIIVVNDKNIDMFKEKIHIEEGTPILSALTSDLNVLSESLDSSIEMTDKINLEDISEKSLSELNLDIDELDDVGVVEDLLLYSLINDLAELIKTEDDISSYELSSLDDSNEVVFTIKKEISEKDKQVEIEYSLFFIEVESNWKLYDYQLNETVVEKEEPKEKSNKKKKDDDEEEKTKA